MSHLKTHIIQKQIDVEQHKSLCSRSKAIIKKDATMAFYEDKEQICLETDALGVDLGASLLQVGDGVLFQRNKAPNSATLQPIALQAKV